MRQLTARLRQPPRHQSRPRRPRRRDRRARHRRRASRCGWTSARPTASRTSMCSAGSGRWASTATAHADLAREYGVKHPPLQHPPRGHGQARHRRRRRPLLRALRSRRLKHSSRRSREAIIELKGFLPAVDDYMRKKLGDAAAQMVRLDRLLVRRLRVRRRDLHQPLDRLPHAQEPRPQALLRPPHLRRARPLHRRRQSHRHLRQRHHPAAHGGHPMTLCLLPSPSGRGAGGEGVTPRKSSDAILQMARSLRANQTSAERRLWALLRDRRLQNAKFRRQQPLGRTSSISTAMLRSS